jgi:hypothetical protein
MENAVKPSLPSDIDPDFWKGFLFGAMAGMVIAAYTYAINDFARPRFRRVPGNIKPIPGKAAA